VWAKKFTLRPLATTSTSVPVAGVKPQICVRNSMGNNSSPSLPFDKSCGSPVPESIVRLLHIRLCVGVEHLDTKDPSSFSSLLGPAAVLFRSCRVGMPGAFSVLEGA